MKLCFVDVDFVENDKFKALNGRTFATLDEVKEAIAACAFVDGDPDDPRYAAEAELVRKELLDSFGWIDPMTDVAAELNEFDADLFVNAHLFVALDWAD